tara:strand:+ start:3534 stop:3995 length:462 start_codon:yes stop_codon:yes gene_type:complete
VAELQRRQELWSRLIADVDGPASRFALHAAGPSIAWLLGHNLVNTDSVAEAVGGRPRSLEATFGDRHAEPHFGVRTDADWNALRALWEPTAIRTRDAVRAQADLDGAPDVPILPEFQGHLTTRRAFLDGHLFHLTWHAGQVGMLRAALNLPWV